MDLPQCTHNDLSLSILPEPMHPAFKLYGGTIRTTCTATISGRIAGNLLPKPRPPWFAVEHWAATVPDSLPPVKDGQRCDFGSCSILYRPDRL